jgi:hypothetical protein
MSSFYVKIEDVYYYLLYTFYVLYIIVILNLSYFNSITKYLPVIQSALKYFVIIFLIVRFNPYSNSKITEFDKKIVFSSSFFLLSTTTATDLLLTYFNKNIARKVGVNIKL